MNRLLLPDNRLFALARMGRRLTHGALAVPLLFGFIVLPVIIVVIALGLLGLDLDQGDLPPLQSATQTTFGLIVQFLPMALALWAWLALYEQRPFWTLGFERQGALWKYGRGVLIGVAMFGLAVALAALPGYIAPEAGNPQRQGSVALGGVLLVYLGWTVQGPIEELLCRGWLLQTVGARHRPWLGVLLSSLVFGVIHLLNPNVSLLAMLNLFLFGVFAALYALWEGGLWGICSLHAAWNWAQGNVFGMEVSGQAPGGGTLFNLQEVGPDLITGGPFGPEAGLAVTAVLIGGVAVLWWLREGDG